MNLDELPFRSLSREQRRERILWAAKNVFFEKGTEEASMDDVAAYAGTTKPTVYAHFKSKDELFSAMLELMKRIFLGRLRSPEAYGEPPVEAIALFCGRFLELAAWRDVVGFQRVLLSSATRAPERSRELYDKLFTGALDCLAVYLANRQLTATPERDAELIVSAAVALPMLRVLYDVAPSQEEAPGDTLDETRVDLGQIREAVALIAAKWER